MRLSAAATGALARLALSTFVALVASGCGASSKEIRAANSSGYEADFAIVYSEVLAVVTDRYPRLLDSPRRGVIQTAWHPLNMRESGGNLGNQPAGQGQPGQPVNPFGIRQGGPDTFFFIRFRVSVVGGKPWRIRIEGEASKWEQGATPVPLRGADTPPWLPARVDGLRLKIHRRLKAYAVRLKPDVDKAPKVVSKPAAEIPGVPKGAAAAVGAVRDAAESRLYDELRKHVADDLVWSEGAPPGAEQGLAMWQADPSLLLKLVEAIEAGCAQDAEAVVCSAGAGPKAVFERVGGGWRLRRFVAVD